MDKDYLDRLKEGIAQNRSSRLVVIGISAILCLVAGCSLLGMSHQSSESFSLAASHETAELLEEDKGSADAVTIVVHVAGAVQAPGVYELSLGARVGDAVEAAGGFCEKADRNALNLARALGDGEQIVIPEIRVADDPAMEDGQTAASANSSPGKVNINSASALQLEALPGIGPTLAQRIVEYRNSKGSFGSIQDLKKVSGIGAKKFEAIEDLITV